MIKTKIYSNGLKLVVDKMENYESVAFNMFVKTGAINEWEGIYGISHFIEHMLFKGTKTKTALEISKSFDILGANVNAYTDQEETDFYTKCASENTEKCVEIMSDMLFNSTFNKTEMKREKRVVIEEIKMYDDDPQSKAELLVNQSFYVGNPFSRDIAGSIKSVRNLTREQILEYKEKFYVPKNITLSFAGNIDFDTAEKLVEKYYLPNFKESGVETNNFFERKNKIDVQKYFKKNSQSQVCIAFSGLYNDDNDLYISKIFDVAFGLGMSSILFQKIREKLGLVYTIYSKTTSNSAGGDSVIYFGTSTKNVSLALSEIAKEIKEIKQNGITKEQFENARTNLMNTIKLSFESTSFVSLFNAKRFSFQNSTLTKSEYVEKIRNTKFEALTNYISSHFSEKNYAISYVGSNTRINIKKHFCL